MPLTLINYPAGRAMLSIPTENALYRLFVDFFRQSEEVRAWNLWDEATVPWGTLAPENADATPAVTDAVADAYAAELLLPDLASRITHLLRGSHGRAWFLTRWTYEEGKHTLALGEWLTRSGNFTDATLERYAEDLLTANEIVLPYDDPVAAFGTALARETIEIERYETLRTAAESAGEAALAAILGRILIDERAHAAFFKSAIDIIRTQEPERIGAAIDQVTAQAEDDPATAQRVLAALNS